MSLLRSRNLSPGRLPPLNGSGGATSPSRPGPWAQTRRRKGAVGGRDTSTEDTHNGLKLKISSVERARGVTALRVWSNYFSGYSGPTPWYPD